MLLTKVVVRDAPFTCTTDPLTKLLPFTVSVKFPPPAPTDVGDMLASEGTGLLTVKVKAPLVPPPGAAFITVIDNVPADAISPARTVAVS